MSKVKALYCKNNYLNIISRHFLGLLFCVFVLLSVNAKAGEMENPDQDRPQKSGGQNMSDLQFLGADAFNQMEEAAAQMNRSISQHRKIVKKILKDAEVKRYQSEGDCSSLTLDQDQKSYIYDLEFSLFDKDDVVINIRNRTLRISADYVKNDQNKTAKHPSSKFKYSLTLPYDADDKPRIIRQDGKITIKFDKVK